MHFREIMLDFFEKVSLAWEDALRYTISFMFVNVPYVYPYLTVKIFSHQQLPGSVYWDLTADSKLKRLTTYLGTVFSFGTFIRQENPACRFLKTGNNIIAIFTKSTYSVPASTKLSLIEVISKLALQRTKKWEVEWRMSEGSDKFIHLYPTNPAL